MPLTSGTRSPISSSEKAKIRCCSSKLQAWTSEAWPLTVMDEIPSTAATWLRWLRVAGSFKLMSSLNAASVAGMTPLGR